MSLQMNIDELHVFLKQVFAQVADQFHIEELEENRVVVRLIVGDEHLRPGGTISGPSMFTLADVSAYVAVLAHIGPKALAVTTNCSIDFMRKPMAATDLLCDCRLLKLGKALAVTDALIYSDGDAKPVARAALTYSIPPL